jgi:hypothetical protein
MAKLFEAKQTEKESIKDFIERFRNLSLLCPPGMPLSMLLQTCRYNFLYRIEKLMGSVKAHSWKELVEQAEIAEKSANRAEPSVPKSKWNFTDKNRDRVQSSQSKGKETMVIEMPKGTSSLPQKTGSGGGSNQESRPPQRQYSFKEEQVVTIFHLLNKGNKLKLPEVKRPEEVGRVNDPNYCLYHRMVHHPTTRCYILKDKIQALVDAGVLTLKSEQKKVGANVISLKFGEMPEVKVQDGVSPIAKGEMKVMFVAANQRDTGFFPDDYPIRGSHVGTSRYY